MKRWLIPVGVVSVAAFYAIFANQSIRSADPPKPPQWEYRVLSWNSVGAIGSGKKDQFEPGDVEKGLNKAAEEGWELVTVTSAGNVYHDKWFYLKRPKAR